MLNRKRSNNTQSELLSVNLSIGTFPTVCIIIQLLVTVTSCFVLAIDIQRYNNKPGTSTLSDWLQSLDGTVLGKKTDNLKSSSFRWPARNFLSMISAIAKWMSANYTSCLLTSLVSQTIVLFISERKRFSWRNFLCLFFWIGLISFSRWQSQNRLIYSTLLSAVTCVISFYLLLILSVGEKMFGRRRKKRRKMKEPKYEVQSNEELQPVNQEERQSNCRKLKLPEDLDELECAEKKLSLHENISLLSLGPCGFSNGRKPNNNGSWFKKESNNFFDADNGRSESPIAGNSLIWPARFCVNGVAIRARNKTNHSITENKKPESFGEFSDDEGCLFQTENYKRKRNDLHRNKRRKRETIKSFCNLCNVQRVILVCSLTLNVIFLWMLKDYSRTAMFTQ